MFLKNGSGSLSGTSQSEWINVSHANQEFKTTCIISIPPSLTGGTFSIEFTNKNDLSSIQGYQKLNHCTADNKVIKVGADPANNEVEPGTAFYIDLIRPINAFRIVADSLVGGSIEFDCIQQGYDKRFSENG